MVKGQGLGFKEQRMDESMGMWMITIEMEEEEEEKLRWSSLGGRRE
jgi:hypothetical protein